MIRHARAGRRTDAWYARTDASASSIRINIALCESLFLYVDTNCPSGVPLQPFLSLGRRFSYSLAWAAAASHFPMAYATSMDGAVKFCIHCG